MLGKKTIMSAIAALFIAGAAAPALAQSPVEDAIGGALFGAGVSAIAGGNVGTGAAVGAGAGVLLGAARRSHQPTYRRTYAPRRAYRRTYVAPVASQLVADIQSSLTNLGYNPGPVDGVMGRGTRAAVREYQTDAGLLVDGRISRPLLNHMRAQGG